MLAVAALAVASCADRAAQMKYEVRRNYGQAPVEAALEVSRTRITVAERIEARLSVSAPSSFAIEMPGFEMDFGEFVLVDAQASETEPIWAGRRRSEMILSLEPYLPGTYAVPAFMISYTDTGDPTRTGTITTGEVFVEVVSALPAGEETPDIRDIAPIAELPRIRWPWIAVGALAAVLALAYALRKKPAPEVPVEVARTPAHEVALVELERLLSEDLVARGEVNRFYTRLSVILRRYLNGRFGFRAPVQTTTEFLGAIEADEMFSRQYKPALEAFMMHCDLVKFAGDRPASEVAEQSFAACKGFILETRGLNEDSPRC